MPAPEQLQAVIGDRQVTVLALRVDGKKMSLQLFRQVPHVAWLDGDGNPDQSMRPWGRVLYRIPGEGESWMLVEKDGQLARCRIDVYEPNPIMVDLYRGYLKTAQENIVRVKHMSPELGFTAQYEAEVQKWTKELEAAERELAEKKRQRAKLKQDLASYPQLFLA
jgi:hypothetical protein